MNIKTIFASALAAAASFAAAAQDGASFAAAAQDAGSLTITLPEGTDTITVIPLTVADAFGPDRRAAMLSLMEKVGVTGQTTYTMAVDPDEAMDINIITDQAPRRINEVFIAPGENITVDLTGSYPVTAGSPLADGITRWHSMVDSLGNAYRALPATATAEEREAFGNTLYSTTEAMIAANADAPLGLYLLYNIGQPEMQERLLPTLTAGATSSILAPMYEAVKDNIARRKAEAAASELIQPGKPAPAFTLPDAEGNPVSLADFKGKWVMLDFWGSWCGWCIKGIPQMKEEWAELKDRDVVFVSIACGDSKEKWLGALSQYGLPWVNVWSDPATPQDETVAAHYAVRGFPTKLVVDPQGRIALVVVGEQPDFYTKLRALLPAD